MGREAAWSTHFAARFLNWRKDGSKAASTSRFQIEETRERRFFSTEVSFYPIFFPLACFSRVMRRRIMRAADSARLRLRNGAKFPSSPPFMIPN